MEKEVASPEIENEVCANEQEASWRITIICRKLANAEIESKVNGSSKMQISITRLSLCWLSSENLNRVTIHHMF